jgi:hypothetical protein
MMRKFALAAVMLGLSALQAYAQSSQPTWQDPKGPAIRQDPNSNPLRQQNEEPLRQLENEERKQLEDEERKRQAKARDRLRRSEWSCATVSSRDRNPRRGFAKKGYPMLRRVCPCCLRIVTGFVCLCFASHFDAPHTDPEGAPPLQVRLGVAAISTAAQPEGAPIVRWRVPSS